MQEVREEIDLIDKEIVLLLAKRQQCIEKAALVKKKKRKDYYKLKIQKLLQIKEYKLRTTYYK